MAESRIIEDKESVANNNEISLLNKEENLLSMDNGSLNNEGEKIITNFNISETPQDGGNVKQELFEDTNIVQISEESNSKQDDINGQIKGKDLINEGEGDSMKFEILKKYMELCNETGLMPSWSELNKFKKYYVG